KSIPIRVFASPQALRRRLSGAVEAGKRSAPRTAASDTDREIGASFDRQGRATRPVVDPRVSFRSAFLKPFRPLSRSTGVPCRQESVSSFRLSGGVPLSD